MGPDPSNFALLPGQLLAHFGSTCQKHPVRVNGTATCKTSVLVQPQNIALLLISKDGRLVTKYSCRLQPTGNLQSDMLSISCLRHLVGSCEKYRKSQSLGSAASETCQTGPFALISDLALLGRVKGPDGN